MDGRTAKAESAAPLPVPLSPSAIVMVHQEPERKADLTETAL